MFYRIFRPFTKSYKRARELYYKKIVPATRRPVFYEEYGVKDDYDGRFNMLTLHLYLVLEQLKKRRDEHKICKDVEQDLVDIFFDDMDTVIRERGTGDMGVSHKVKKLANRFYGRFKGYQAAESREDMAAALVRNVYRDAQKTAQAEKLAAYVMKVRAALAGQKIEDLVVEPDYPEA